MRPVLSLLFALAETIREVERTLPASLSGVSALRQTLFLQIDEHLLMDVLTDHEKEILRGLKEMIADALDKAD